MKIQQLGVKLRVFLVWELLQKFKGRKILLRELKPMVEGRLTGKVNYRQLWSAIATIKKDHTRPGVEIETHGTNGTEDEMADNSVELFISEDSNIDTERLAFPELKKSLGDAVWHVLFNVPLPKDVEIEGTADQYHEWRRKIAALRSRPTVSLSVDAGSTMEYAIDQFLQIKEIPLRINHRIQGANADKAVAPVLAVEDAGSEAEAETDDDDSDQTEELPSPDFTLIWPTITTNSVSIANRVAESFHRRHIQLRLIGGDLRIERTSICGSLTEIGLWQAKEDVALIGCTGYWPVDASGAPRANSYGYPAFACDNVSEAWLKTTLLERASLRIVIMHSGKLVHAVGSVFAPLLNTAVDCVVIDDGVEIDKKTNIGAREAVKKFLAAAADAKVPVVLVKSAPKTPRGRVLKGGKHHLSASTGSAKASTKASTSESGAARA